MKRATLLLLLAVVSVTTARAQTRFLVTLENVGPAHPVLKSGVFNTPEGADAPGPILPGEAYAFSFSAGPGMHLSLATMFVQSNDLFYAFAPEGLPLFDEHGDPVSGDVTAALALWDAGTEVDEEPGVGANQAPRQSGPNTGADEQGVIVMIPDGGTNDGFTYPMRDAVIQVTLLSNTSVAVEPAGDALPERFRLYPNYPNPFNPSTEIRYDLAQAGPVRLAVYDVLGREVAVLVDRAQSAGSYRTRWDGTDAAGRTVASGLYLYRLDAAGTARTRRMVLLK